MKKKLLQKFRRIYNLSHDCIYFEDVRTFSEIFVNNLIDDAEGKFQII